MTRFSTRRAHLIASLAATGLLLTACGKQPAESVAASAAKTVAAKVYVVGTDAAYAPFESQNEKGEIVGFDIDIVKAIAAKAGFAVKFVNTPWEGIFNALAQGDRDLVVSSVSITPERQQTMDFSDPYMVAQQLIVVKTSSPVARLADLKSLKVGVQTGTSGDEVVTKLQGKTSANLKRFESMPLVFKELEAGGIDAVVADNGLVIHYLKNNPDGQFKSIDDRQFAPEQVGIALKKGNTELLARVNQGLAAIRADGTYDKIYAEYFGAPPAAAAAASAPAASK